ncbi:MAG: hypothetical protein PHQ59_03160 [Candidatus Daviesbacteria bacterium]|nr:hypothetical protein [Candidatus Daviesbacteria bacterium]
MDSLQKADNRLHRFIRRFSKKHLILFVLILSVISISMVVFIGNQLNPSVSIASESLIYSDSLSSGWYNWSWSANIDFFSTTIVRSGNTSIAFTPQAWGGLSPAMASGTLDTNPYTNLRFYINGGSAGGQRLNIEIRNGDIVGPSININNYIEGGSIAANQWRKVDIPLSILKGSVLTNGIINRIALKEALGISESTVYIDDLGFYTAAVLTPTPTLTSTPTVTPIPTNTVTPSPTSSISSPVIYSDSLAKGWANWSWSSTVNLSSTKNSYSGNRSIAFTPAGGGGFSPALTSGSFDISPYNQITFYINGGTVGNQLFALELRDSSTIGPRVPINNYIEGGRVAANQWKKVAIPLSVLKGSVLGNSINRLALVSTSGSSQDTVYLEDIIFVNGSDIITPLPTSTIIPTITPTPTLSITPTRINTPTPTSVITVSPSPTVTAPPITEVCTASLAAWSASANPVIEGTLTNLNVITSGNCDGKTVSFEVWAATGVAGVGDTRSRVSPSNAVIVNNQATGSWVAEYIQPAQVGVFQQIVSFFENIITPQAATASEYYFKVNMVGDTHTVTSADPKMVVNQQPPVPSGDVVSINTESTVGTISADFYGNNLTPYGGPSMTKNQNFINKVAPLKYNTIRIPGGYEADGYHWWNGTMQVLADRGYMWTGTPPQLVDYLYFTESVGAKPMITVNYRSGTPREAANWVEYMNSPVPANPGAGWTTSSYAGNQAAPKGYFAWLRAQPGPTTTCKVCAGHPAPYGAKYWEVGNEIYYHRDGNRNLIDNPEHYAVAYVPFADAMKAVDPSIKVGFVMEAYDKYVGSWTDRSIKALAANNTLGKVDFLVVHWYRYWDDGSYNTWGIERQQNAAYGHNDFVKYAGSYPKIAADWMRGLLEAASPGSSNRIELNLTEWGPNSGEPCDWDVLSIYSHLFAMRTLAEAQLSNYFSTTYWNINQGTSNFSMIQDNYQVGPIYWAFDMMKDFGRGGDKLVSASSGNPNVYTYASKLSNGSLSILLLNNSSNSSNMTVKLSGFTPSGTATLRQYDQALLGTSFKEYPKDCSQNQPALPQDCCTHGATNRNGGPQTPPRQSSLNGIGNQFNISLPADSSTILVIPSSSGTVTPTLTLTPTITQTSTPVPTLTTTPAPTSPPTGSMSPNMIISRGKTVSASSGDGQSLVNGIYNDYGWRPGIPTASSPAWIAINIGSGPSRLLLNWTNTASYNYTDTGYGTPSDYVIQTSGNSTNGRDGTWSNVVTVAANNVRNRAHSFDFSGKSWVRLYITKTTASSWNNMYGVALDEIDIHDVSRSSSDTWFFMGDSLTANDNRSNQPDYAASINAFNSSYYPAEINGGIGFETSANGVSHIDNWLSLNPDMKYWAINYGGNDAAGNNSNTTNFRNNMQIIINKIKAAGKIPVIARIHYIADGNHNNIAAFNTVIDDLARTNGLIPGPDLYTWFYNHQNELGPDRLHPNSLGSVSINRLWSESMRGLYTNAGSASTSTVASTTNNGFGIQTITDFGQTAVQTIQDFATQVIQLYNQPK